MTIRIAINGFGRIGRNILRALEENHNRDFEIVRVNDLSKTDNLAHLLKYDSVHGRFNGSIESQGDILKVNEKKINVSSVSSLEDLNWSNDGIDIVMECTGIFTHRDKAADHLKAGAKRVLISAPGAGADKTIVYGVNHKNLSADDKVVSNGSCTTNALAPLAKVLNDSFGIKNGFMTTIHAYTGDQPTLDTIHNKDFNRGRASAMSMIPTSTGVASAIGLVIPELEGKLDGKAIRVPTPNVSVVDFTVNLEKNVEISDILNSFRIAEKGTLKNILQVVDDKTVSIDFNHDPHSSSLIAGETVVIDGSLVRVLSWYDNEWGFSNRMLDTASEMSKFF